MRRTLSNTRALPPLPAVATSLCNNCPSFRQAEVVAHHLWSASSNKRSLALNADVISEILAATRAMPSWKACEVEGTSWAGAAEENIQKYDTSIGTEEEFSAVSHSK